MTPCCSLPLARQTLALYALRRCIAGAQRAAWRGNPTESCPQPPTPTHPHKRPPSRPRLRPGCRPGDHHRHADDDLHDCAGYGHVLGAAPAADSRLLAAADARGGNNLQLHTGKGDWFSARALAFCRLSLVVGLVDVPHAPWYPEPPTSNRCNRRPACRCPKARGSR